MEWKPDLNLQWSHFKTNEARQDPNTVAYSYTGLQYEAIKSTNPKVPIQVTIKSLFDVDKSWKLNESLPYQVLNHERRHFDITEIYARILRKFVDEKIKTSKDFDLYFERQYKKVYVEYRNFQELYDRETNHGIHQENQEKYNQLIAKRLQELKNYELN